MPSPDGVDHTEVIVHARDAADAKAHASSRAGVVVVAKDLTYEVASFKDKGVKARLLSDVNGLFNPGEMTALLGPSGSGKTTFLDVLAGRKTVGETTGEVLFGGKAPSIQFLRRHTGYVEQFDTLIAALTVREMLCYTAELKRPMNEPLASKETAVDKLLRDLGLWDARDVVVGSQMVKGISGGQAKRTNIAIALITDPSVLFLDEPTSGLDSFTANEVMSVVKSLVTDEVTILATIHSPTAYAFSLFDNAMILCGGRQVYFGPTGKGLVQYAATSLPGVTPKEKDSGHSDIEWLIDVFTEADRRGDAVAFADVYETSSLKKACDASTRAAVAAEKVRRRRRGSEESLADGVTTQSVADTKLNTTSSTVTPGWWAFYVMLKYRTRKNYRDPEYLGPRLGDKIFLSFIITTLYLGRGNDFGADNVINISSALFMWSTLPAFGAAAYIPQIVLERSLYMRERADGLYNPLTYVVAKICDEMLLLVFVTLCIAVVVFFAVDLAGSFWLFWLTYYITLGNGIVLAYLVAAAAPNMEAANAILPTYVVTLLFFAGFLITPEDTPSYWKWYSYVDLMKYAWGALMINQWDGNDPVLFAGGETLLETYELDDVNKWGYVGYLLLFFCAFFVLAFLALKHINHSKR